MSSPPERTTLPALDRARNRPARRKVTSTSHSPVPGGTDCQLRPPSAETRIRLERFWKSYTPSGELKRAGYDGIIVTGASETPVRIRIHDDEVSILPADGPGGSALWGVDALDTLEALEEADGKKLLVMELVEGPDLTEYIQQGPMPLDKALPIALQISEALEVMQQYRISGVPVTKGGKLVGIMTNRDLRFETNLDQPISNVMTKDKLVTVPPGTTLEEAKKHLHEHRIEKLPVVDKDGKLKGLITIKDIEKTYIEGWRLGLKAIAIYRDGCKRSQPLSTGHSCFWPWGPTTAATWPPRMQT